MIKRPLGSTGCLISPIGLGTIKFGRDQKVKYPHSFTIPSDGDARNLLAYAFDLGINLLDTAPAYGTSEERLGRLLFPNRKQWVIGTKVGEDFINGRSFFDFSLEYTRRSIERSLKRLRTDYLDIVLVHSNGDDLRIIEEFGILDILAEFKKAGLIRAYGMSTKTVEGGLLAAKKSDVVMITYNLRHKEEEPVIHFARENNKGVLIKKAFDSGHVFYDTQVKVPLIDSIGCIFQHWGVTSIIVGTLQPNHLEQSVNAALNSLARHDRISMDLTSRVSLKHPTKTTGRS